jgi:hypothetical protein
LGTPSAGPQPNTSVNAIAIFAAGAGPGYRHTGLCCVQLHIEFRLRHGPMLVVLTPPLVTGVNRIPVILQSLPDLQAVVNEFEDWARSKPHHLHQLGRGDWLVEPTLLAQCAKSL